MCGIRISVGLSALLSEILPHMQEYTVVKKHLSGNTIIIKLSVASLYDKPVTFATTRPFAAT